MSCSLFTELSHFIPFSSIFMFLSNEFELIEVYSFCLVLNTR